MDRTPSIAARLGITADIAVESHGLLGLHQTVPWFSNCQIKEHLWIRGCMLSLCLPIFWSPQTRHSRTLTQWSCQLDKEGSTASPYYLQDGDLHSQTEISGDRFLLPSSMVICVCNSWAVSAAELGFSHQELGDKELLKVALMLWDSALEICSQFCGFTWSVVVYDDLVKKILRVCVYIPSAQHSVALILFSGEIL